MTMLPYIWQYQIYQVYIDIKYRQKGGQAMNTRRLTLGDRNMVRTKVTEARNKLGMKQVELLVKL